jgi:hypothetical protein
VYSVSGNDKVLFSDAGDVIFNDTIAFTSAYSFASATAGSSGATPAQVAGYLKIFVGTGYVKVPYYNL